MIDIKNVNNELIYSAPITDKAVYKKELMKDEFVRLSFNHESYIPLEAGSYIEYKGEKYVLIEPYTPQRLAEGGYAYEPEFHSRVMLWKKRILLFGNETEWTGTMPISQIMNIVRDNLNANEVRYTYCVDSEISEEEHKTLQFQSTSIFDALCQIAEAWSTEWWVEKEADNRYQINISRHKIEGDSLILEAGSNISIPQVNVNKEEYYTRFYAFGSTRNITQDYNSNNGGITNHLVQKRLTLSPVDYPTGYRDIRDGLTEDEIFATTLIFDDVYPKEEYYIWMNHEVDSNVGPEYKDVLDGEGKKEQIGTDNAGNPIYQTYAVWRFKIAKKNFKEQGVELRDDDWYIYNNSQIIRGLDLSIQFLEGQLRGWEFKLRYDSARKVFEIIPDESSGIMLPGIESLIPAHGEKICLFNVDLGQEQDSNAIREAQNLLAQKLDDEIKRRGKDHSTYSFDSNPVYFRENNIDLQVGRSVKLIDGETNLETRVLSVEKRLDYDGFGSDDAIPPYQKISVGETKPASTMKQLKEEVLNVNHNLEVIASLNEMRTELSNAYSYTQRKIIEGLSAWGDMWSFDKKEDPNDPSKWWVVSKFNVASKGAITALGVGTSGNGSGTGSNYELPIASATVLGGIKVGANLNIDSQGVLSASPSSSYTLPVASASVLGGVKVGAGLDIVSGVLNLKSGITTSGTYTKVTVDTYGRVTQGTSLIVSDIPTLTINKISGLQTALNNKLSQSVFDDLFEKVNSGTEANPVWSIKAKYGLWTDYFLSAKGMGTGGGGGATSLGGLINVGPWADETPTADRLMIQRASSTHWTSINLSEIGGNYTLPTASASVLGGIKIGVTLDITAGVANLKSGIVTPGTYPKLTVDTYGRVTGGTSLAATDIPDLSAGKITTGILPIARGGTGKTSIASGAMYYASAANVLNEIATSTFGRSLLNATSGSTFTGLVAEKATTLATARTIWGISFSGANNIGGTITPFASATYDVGTASVLFRHGYFSGNITGGTANGAYLQLGNIRLRYDSANSALYVEKSDGTAANFYATGGVAAKGMGSGGGTGGGGLIESVYSYNDLGDLSKFSNSTLNDTFNAYTINRLTNRLSSLETNVPLSFVTSGSGNAVTGVSKSGNAVTLLKDSTFLTTTTGDGRYILQSNEGNLNVASALSLQRTVIITDFTTFDPNTLNLANGEMVTFYASSAVGRPENGGNTASGTLMRVGANYYRYIVLGTSGYPMGCIGGWYQSWQGWKYEAEGDSTGIALNAFSLRAASNRNTATEIYDTGRLVYYNNSNSASGVYPAIYGTGLFVQRAVGTSVATTQNTMDLWVSYANNENLYFRKGRGNGTEIVYSPWRILLHDGNYSSTLDSRYVLKAGDTMTAPLSIGTANWKARMGASTTANLGIFGAYDTANETWFGYLRVGATLSFRVQSESAAFDVYHAGNSNKSNVNWTGAVGSFDTLTIRNTGGVGHLNFSRPGPNYITAPTSGYIVFTVNGKSNGANSEMIIRDGSVTPYTTQTTTLGTTAYRWNGIYSTIGNFSGAITCASTITSTAVQGFNNTVPTANWAYMRLTSGAASWDIAVQDTQESGSLQLRKGGSNTLKYHLNTDGLYYGTNNSATLGSVSYRWSNVYSVLGNFGGNVSVNYITSGITYATTIHGSGITVDRITTGGWANSMNFRSNGVDRAAFGAYGSGDSLTYAFIGSSYTAATTWFTITPTAATFKTSVTAAGAIITASHLYTNGKTSSTDGKTGFTLNNAGVLSGVGSTTGIDIRSFFGLATAYTARIYEAASGRFNHTALSYFSNTTDATSATSFASIRTAGGISVAKTVYVGGNILALGAITAKVSSDRELKTNFRNIDAGKMLSRMPIQLYDFKGIAKRINPHTPESAISPVYQDAIRILPSMDVKEKGDRYGSLNYLDTNYINLIAATAQQNYRQILDHEERIALLEKENKELKQIINKLKTT